MKITSTIYPKTNIYSLDLNQQPTKKAEIKTNKPSEYISELPYFVDYSRVTFTGVKPPKKVNIENETRKLLREIDNILSSDIGETDLEDMISSMVRKTVSFFRRKSQKMQELCDKLEELSNTRFASPQQKFDAANQLKKEFKAVQNSKPPKFEPVKTSQKDEKFDFALLNRFKSAIYAEDFNLFKVFKEYYARLNEIRTIEELQKVYPKIKIPERPDTIIGRKIENNFTRDFYETLYENFDNPEKMCKIADERIKEEIVKIAEKYEINPQILYDRLASEAHNAVLERLTDIDSSGAGLARIPQSKKSQITQVTETDINLLSIDYDDFVLSTIRKQYLGLEKLNEINYTDSLTGIEISPSSLRNTEYKFEKFPEKIKAMLRTGKQIQTAQRDYDNFGVQELRKRLSSFLNDELSDNNEIFEHIVTFDDCKFEPDDIPQLRRFLRELDLVHDGEKSCEEALSTIAKEEIRPTGTEKVNNAEKAERLKALKLEQQNTFRLTREQQIFDNAITLLYENNMNNLALTCMKYRPEDITPTSIEKTKSIIDIINKCLQPKSGDVNKVLLENSLTRIDTFYDYQKTQPNNPIFKKAVKMASDENGSIDIQRAGQYLFNNEIVQSYPESLQFVKNPEILETIMNRCNSDTDMAVQYLSKFDKYTDLFNADKSKISKILEIFDEKDSIDKMLIKYILENDYSNVDTPVKVFLNDASEEFITATFASSAKKQIMEKYKFPLSIKYLEAFESALSTFAQAKNSSGIKRVGTNNKALEYKAEVKVAGMDDRLFAKNDNYYFDIFSDRGLH